MPAAKRRCRRSPPRIITTWPCFTEAMYLAYRTGEWPMQRSLWRYVLEEFLALHPPELVRLGRINPLMERYRDLPIDLGDASRVEAAESLGFARIFTLERHFHVYRMEDSRAFDVVPA
jgi:predicted nucleic acid-binding protein